MSVPFNSSLYAQILAQNSFSRPNSWAPFESIPPLMSGWYFVVFLSRVYAANMALQYANSMNCMVILVVGALNGGGYMDVL